jgi:hypothetical protein
MNRRLTQINADKLKTGIHFIRVYLRSSAVNNPLVFLCVLCVLCGSRSFAADWYKLGDTTFPERRAVTVTNETDAPAPGTAVIIKLNDLKVSDDARGVAVIVDPGAAPALPDESGGAVVSHQVNPATATLIFSCSLEPRQSRTYFLYTTSQAIRNVPLKHQTSTDIREAWRSFENNLMAFRIEIGKAAKTTGLTIDLFGKTAQGQSEGAILKKIYASDYHQLQPWGIDILKVGSSPGLGGVYVFDGDASARTSAETTEFTVLEEGPVQTRVRAHGPAELKGRKLDVARTLTLTADDRGIDDVVEVKLIPPPPPIASPARPATASATKPAPTLDGLLIGIGLRNLPNETWTQNEKQGYAFVDGDGNQAGTDHLGLGFVFAPSQYVRTTVIDDKTNGGHIVLLDHRRPLRHIPFSASHPEPPMPLTSITSHHHLAAYWNGDGQISTKDAFEQYLKSAAVILQQPPKVEIGPAERRP